MSALIDQFTHDGNRGDFENQNRPLSSPFSNFTFENYPNLQNLMGKLSNCGSNYVTLLNVNSGEVISIPLYCNNRVCLNPECQKHRLYLYMREHNLQITALNSNMRKPKGWVFSNLKRPFPIDRKLCQSELKRLYLLLNKSKHSRYGSNSLFSVHMEIKLNSDSWYLHFHVVSGGITDLRFVRKMWGYQIKYESAISPIDLGYYVSKYASKVPSFPNKMAYLEYGQSVYKLQMHRFSARIPSVLRESEWIIIERKSTSTKPLFIELQNWLNTYLNDYGFGS